MLKNKSLTNIQITYTISETNRPSPSKNAISFTLRNGSARTLPLIIPDVMNPNLSPFSNSGVRLKVGQEIFFLHKGKKYLLFMVSEEIKEGSVLEITQLVKREGKN